MSTFKVGDRVRVTNEDSVYLGLVGRVSEAGAEWMPFCWVTLAKKNLCFRDWELSAESSPDRLVTDLTLDELREWIADWWIVECLYFSKMSVDDIMAWEDWANPEDRGAGLWELRDELLEAYADRLRESVQP